MKFIATSLPLGILLLLTQAQEPGRKAIHLAEITCKTFVEEMKPEEHRIIIAWLQGYYLPEHDPPVIDVDKLSSDSAKLREHCLNNPEDDLMTAAEAVFSK
jgi:acid stress chaperone HdeB